MAKLTQASLRPSFSLLLLAPTFLVKVKTSLCFLGAPVLILCLWLTVAQPVDSDLQVKPVMHLVLGRCSYLGQGSAHYSPGSFQQHSDELELRCWLGAGRHWESCMPLQIPSRKSGSSCLLRLTGISSVIVELHVINPPLPAQFLWRGSAMVTHRYIKVTLSVLWIVSG